MDPLDLADELESLVGDRRVPEEVLQKAVETIRDQDARIDELQTELDDTNEGMMALTLELQEAEQRYRTLFEDAAEGIYKTPPDLRRYEMANESMAEILGYGDPSAIENEVALRDVFVDPERYETYAEELQANGALEGFEYRVRRKDGAVRWVSDSVRALEGENGREGYRGGVIDITTQKEYERRLESQRDNLEVLNQIVRHDIRNDLQVIQLHAEGLAANEGVQIESLERIQENAREAVDITDDARRVTEVMLEEDAEFSPVDIRQLLDEELREIASNYDDVAVEVDGDLPACKVAADEMLESVFRNLLKNAVLHNDEDVATIRVSVDCGEETVLVRIADNGPGVPDQQKEAIFEEGEQGLDSDGTGLGLYLVQTLVDRYDGRVWVEDNEPQGSVFCVELPGHGATRVRPE